MLQTMEIVKLIIDNCTTSDALLWCEQAGEDQNTENINRIVIATTLTKWGNRIQEEDPETFAKITELSKRLLDNKGNTILGTKPNSNQLW